MVLLSSKSFFFFMFHQSFTAPRNSTKVQNRKKHSNNSQLIIHIPNSLGVSERASKRVGAAEVASKTSKAEQMNEWAVWANKRTDEQVARSQHLHLDSWVFWTIANSKVEKWLMISYSEDEMDDKMEQILLSSCLNGMSQIPLGFSINWPGFLYTSMSFF